MGISREVGSLGRKTQKDYILFLMKKTDALTEPPNEMGEVQAVAVF